MADEIKKIPVTAAAPSAAIPPLQPTTLDDERYKDVRDQLVTRYELLPDDLKALIVDDGYRTKLFEIAKELKMTYEELGTLEIETTMVLLGMTAPADFRDEIQIQLKKNDGDIDKLVALVNERVFTPIRASLEKIYAAKKEPTDYLNENILEKVENDIAAQKATPAPQIAPAPKAEPNLTDTEKNVLAKTGVVLSEASASAKPTVAAPLPNRTDILAGIENPKKIQTGNPVSDKLSSSAPVIPTTRTTDYSVPKPPTISTSPTTPSAPKTDPYREKIE